jgi:hypothetical protein
VCAATHLRPRDTRKLGLELAGRSLLFGYLCRQATMNQFKPELVGAGFSRSGRRYLGLDVGRSELGRSGSGNVGRSASQGWAAIQSRASLSEVNFPKWCNGKMIYSSQSCAAVMMASLSLLLMAATAATSKPCLTKEEAKKLWPNEWLYWHTERHCWDHIKGTSGTYAERQPEPTQ